MPYPHEHSCRLEDPDKYERFSRKNCAEKSNKKCIDHVYGILKGKSELQAMRYPKDKWKASDARAHCDKRGGSFEAAEEKKKGETGMANEIVTKESFKEAYPGVFGEIHVEGYETGYAAGLSKGKEEGAGAERNRIKEVEAQCIVGHEALINELKFDGKTTGPEAALKVLGAEKKIRTDMAADITADAIKPVAQPPAPVGGDGVDPNLPVEERAKAQWDRSPDLRAEFNNNFKSYLSFLKNEEMGNVRILRKERKQ